MQWSQVCSALLIIPGQLLLLLEVANFVIENIFCQWLPPPLVSLAKLQQWHYSMAWKESSVVFSYAKMSWIWKWSQALGTDRIPLLSSCVAWRLLSPQTGRTNQATLTLLSVAYLPSQLERVNGVREQSWLWL